MNNRTCFLVICVLCCLLTAACRRAAGSGDAQTVDIVYWQYFHQTKVEMIDELIVEFEKQNPGIRVEHIHFPYETYNEKVASSVLAGTGPDVINLFYGWLPLYIKEGYLRPLPHEVFDAAYFEKNFFPFVEESVKFNGRYYSVPTAVTARALLWNKKLFREAGLDPDKPPATLDELLEYARKLSKYDAQGNLIQSGLGLAPANQGHSWIREVLIRQFGGIPYSADGRQVSYHSPQGTEALKWYTDSIIVHRVGAPAFISDEVAGFRTQLIAMIVDGSQRIALYRGVEGLDFGIAGLPTHNGIRSNYASFWANSVTTGVEGSKLDASVEFLKFLASPEVQSQWLDKVGELPANPEIAAMYIDMPYVGEFLKGLEDAHTTIFVDEAGQRDIFVNMVDRVVLNDLSPAEAILEAAEKEQKLIDDFWR